MKQKILNNLLIIRTLAVNELKVKYKRSSLGFFWSLLNPVLNIALISIVFSEIMKMPYKEFVLFLFPGLVTWNLFVSVVNGSSNTLIQNESLIINTPVDKIIFPFVIGVSMAIDFILIMSVFMILLILLGKASISLVILPFAILLLLIFAIGIGLIVCVLNTCFRDVGYITTILLQVMFFLTPILYPRSRLVAYDWIAKYNPVGYFIEMFRVPIYQGHFPSINIILINSAFAICAFLIGFVIFRKYQDNLIFRL